MKLNAFYYRTDLSINANLIINCCWNWKYRTVRNFVLMRATGLSKSSIIRAKRELINKHFIFPNWAITDDWVDFVNKEDKKHYTPEKKELSELEKQFKKVFDGFK